MPIDLVTEAEAAELLRCQVSKVKRLRRSGKLPYIPGRPPLIDRADLDVYIEAEKVRGAAKTPEGQKKLRDAEWERRVLFRMMNPQKRNRKTP